MKRGTQKIKSKSVDRFTLIIYIPNFIFSYDDLVPGLLGRNSPTAILMPELLFKGQFDFSPALASMTP
jgi:hypothetical protein